jgi:hypothetical protein
MNVERNGCDVSHSQSGYGQNRLDRLRRVEVDISLPGEAAS